MSNETCRCGHPENEHIAYFTRPGAEHACAVESCECEAFAPDSRRAARCSAFTVQAEEREGWV